MQVDQVTCWSPSLSLSLAASCTPGEQGGEEWKADRVNIAPGFLRSEQSLCPFPQTSMQGRAVMQG